MSLSTGVHPGVNPATRAELDAAEFQLLRGLWSLVVEGNAFYRRKLKGVPSPGSLSEFREATPFTVKAELVEDQALHPPFGSNLSFPAEEYVRFSQTSGSTGQPLRWIDTAESWSRMVDLWVRVFLASGVRAGDRILFAFSFGPFLGFWTAFDAGSRLGCMALPGGGLSSSARLRMLIDARATVLCCTPTYALRLAEVACEDGLDLRSSAVHTIIAAGEPGASIPATRARIEAAWPGARVKDHHGMTEVGPVTYECPSHAGRLHVLEPDYLPEVLEPGSGGPVGPGGEGELVLTNLGRGGSPLLRYRTGDRVRRTPQGVCSCGSSELGLDGGILGRIDDMCVVRGVNLYPTAIEAILRGIPEVVEYQVELRRGGAMTEVAVRIETVVGSSDGTAARLEQALRDAFHLRIPVEVVPASSLPRFELKARRWRVVEREASGE